MNLDDQIFKPTSFAGHLVPGIWRYMLPQNIFDFEAPAERRATCMDCPNIQSDGFRPDYRCCTYHPAVPNYALGFALETSLGRKPVEALIKNGYTLPEGSLHTPKEWIDYLADNKYEKFGKSEKVLCHLLDKDTGYCTIYAFRNSVCSTFFCQHDHGKKGEYFWEQTQALVGQVEAVLCQWALEQAGFSVSNYMNTLDGMSDQLDKVASPNGGWTAAARKELFGEHFGKEIELYKACAKAIYDNREDLWQIANEHPILEASKFETTQIKMVPEEFSSEIDETDFSDGETLAPKEIWKKLKKTHKRLWNAPDQKLLLNKKAFIHKNEKDDQESKHNKDKPYVLEFLTKKDSDSYEWRNFLSKKEYQLLNEFTKPKKISSKLDKKHKSKEIPEPNKRITEWFGKKVLVKG